MRRREQVIYSQERKGVNSPEDKNVEWCVGGLCFCGPDLTAAYATKKKRLDNCGKIELSRNMSVKESVVFCRDIFFWFDMKMQSVFGERWDTALKGLVMESTMDTSQMDKLLPSKKSILYLTNYIWWMCVDLKEREI